MIAKKIRSLFDSAPGMGIHIGQGQILGFVDNIKKDDAEVGDRLKIAFNLMEHDHDAIFVYKGLVDSHCFRGQQTHGFHLENNEDLTAEFDFDTNGFTFINPNQLEVEKNDA